MSNPNDTLQILIDVRSRLDDVVKAQAEFRKMREEVSSASHALQIGFGVDVVHRGLDFLKDSLQETALRAFEMADAIKDGARNLEISNLAYQVLGNVIHDAGGDMQLLTMAVSNSNRSLVEARSVGTAAAGAYRTLGLDIAKLEQMPAERRFELIGRAVLGATDKTQAYSAASQILGARNLPTLLGALKDLAENGWDKVTEAQVRAGRVMSDDTIVRLEAAKKNIEKLKQSVTIGVGESIGFLGALGNSFKKDFGGTLWDFIKGGPMLGPGLLGRVAIDNPPEETTPPPDSGAATREIALKTALAQAEYNLAAATLHRQTVEANPNQTDYQKKARNLMLLEEELSLRTKLIAATRAAPLDATETQQARDLKVRKLEEQNQQLRDQINRLQFQTDAGDREQATRDKFSKFVEDGKGGNLNVSGAASLGAMEWVTGLGTAGEQVSNALQSSLGATVSGITDGIYGWITGTKSFGASILQLGATVFQSFLQTIIQMGVQWLVTQTLIKAGMINAHAVGEGLRVQRIAGATAEGAATQAAMAPAAATSSIASFGAAAVLGIAALIAAMAIFGGFSSGGYTGDMSRTSVAGVVHGQEYVLNAAATSRLGTGFLDTLNAGAPLSVAAAPAVLGGSGGAPGAAGSRDSGRNIHVYLDRSAWLDAVQNDLTGIAHEVYDKRNRA